MNKPEANRLERLAKLVYTLTLLGMLVYGVTWRALQARQKGMGALQALESAIHLDVYVVMTLAAVALGMFLCLSFLRRFSETPTTSPPVEKGRTRWRRLRVPAIVIAVLYAFESAWRLAKHASTGSWHSEDWLYLAGAALLAVVAIGLWMWEPSPEELHDMGSEHPSRVNDERTQRVQEKASLTTLRLFLLFLMFVGIPYEAIVYGRWPVITMALVVILGIIQQSTRSYWNRRL